CAVGRSGIEKTKRAAVGRDPAGSAANTGIEFFGEPVIWNIVLNAKELRWRSVADMEVTKTNWLRCMRGGTGETVSGAGDLHVLSRHIVEVTNKVHDLSDKSAGARSIKRNPEIASVRAERDRPEISRGCTSPS